MSVRSALASGSHRLKAIAQAPPWYVRMFGGLFLLGSLGTYLGESLVGRHTESVIELFGHVFFLLAGVTMLYPEGATKLMGFARRTMPGLDRRSGPREPPKESD